LIKVGLRIFRRLGDLRCFVFRDGAALFFLTGFFAARATVFPAGFFAAFFAGRCADFLTGFFAARAAVFPAGFFAAFFAGRCADFLTGFFAAFFAGRFADFLTDFFPARAAVFPAAFFAGRFADFFLAPLEVNDFFLPAAFFAAPFFFLDLLFVAIPWSPVDATLKSRMPGLHPFGQKLPSNSLNKATCAKKPEKDSNTR